jgi:cytochrome c
VVHFEVEFTPDEAKAMVDNAYSYLKENGKEEAFAEISNPQGKFVKEDLYVLVVDFKIIAFAFFPPNELGEAFKDT